MSDLNTTMARILKGKNVLDLEEQVVNIVKTLDINAPTSDEDRKRMNEARIIIDFVSLYYKNQSLEIPNNLRVASEVINAKEAQDINLGSTR